MVADGGSVLKRDYKSKRRLLSSIIPNMNKPDEMNENNIGARK